ncbi:MAG: PLP-dependent aminotransferase family protein [Candidatus Omnitrophota bacterium]
MKLRFAERMRDVPKSFIREILKAAADPKIISFAGGLPNPDLFPVEGVQEACAKVLRDDGQNVLQYTTTEGYPPLREFIAERYRAKKGLAIRPDEILITNGSQQGLDLLGKILLNEGDGAVIEKPGYLGAIQALSIYKPVFHSIPLHDDGVDASLAKRIFQKNPIQLFYSVPNFQNPSGVTYSKAVREELAAALKEYGVLFVEDDPYGELRFMGEDLPSMRNYLDGDSILLGSFSKIVAPAFRMGWICAGKEIMEKLVIAKQAADLHSNSFSQRVLYQYLSDCNIDDHIAAIRCVYKNQRDAMAESIDQYLPSEIQRTNPEGGMFLWLTLPDGASSMMLFQAAVERNVAFVPGYPFYVDGGGENTLRLNYSNADESTIKEGIQRLAQAWVRMGL